MILRGLDASFDRLTDETATKLRAAGYKVFAQALWTGRVTPEVAQDNLRVALRHEFIPVGYISLAGATPGDWHIDRGRAAVNDATWDALALAPVDVELKGIPKYCVTDALRRTRRLGKRDCIYTSWHAWVDFMDNTTAFADALLWNALWDEDEDFDFPSLPYGGWTIDKVVAEQYTGGRDVLGIYADKDVFVEELLLPKEKTMFHIYTPEEKEASLSLRFCAANARQKWGDPLAHMLDPIDDGEWEWLTDWAGWPGLPQPQLQKGRTRIDLASPDIIVEVAGRDPVIRY